MELVIALGFVTLVWMFWLIYVRQDEQRDFVTHLFNTLTGQLEELNTEEHLNNISHDLQQIKVRLTWSKKREKQDLKAELLAEKSRRYLLPYKGTLPTLKTTATGVRLKK
jgi:hypothetical protein